MEKNELISRMDDLAAQCQRRSVITHSHFLTPAEQHQISNITFLPGTDGSSVLYGGTEESERKILFFLPYYMTEDDLDWSETISVLESRCRFGKPGHRDYLGSLMVLGIRREFLGDIWMEEETAYLFCMSTIKDTILNELKQVGHNTVTVREISARELPDLHRQMRSERFTVMSPRLDAVVSGMFRLSRTESAERIRQGLVQHNYQECVKTDAPVREGDVISLRGRGKGVVAAFEGTTRRGRMFIEVKIYQ